MVGQGSRGEVQGQSVTDRLGTGSGSGEGGTGRDQAQGQLTLTKHT